MTKEDSLFLGSINETAEENGAMVTEVITYTELPWCTKLVICRTTVNFTTDACADTTIINGATNSHVKPKLRPVIVKLESPGRQVSHKLQFLANIQL